MKFGKIAWIVTVCLGVGVFLGVFEATAFNPPPGDAHYMGPAIIGEFTVRPGDEGIGGGYYGLIFDFVGNCAGETIAVYNDDTYADPDTGGIYYGDVTEEGLTGNVLQYWSWLPEQCLPNLKGKTPDGLAFINVKNYLESESPPQKSADVILLWVVPQGK